MNNSVGIMTEVSKTFSKSRLEEGITKKDEYFQLNITKYHWCSKVVKAQNPHQNARPHYYLRANQYHRCQTCLSAPCCFTPLFYFQGFFSCKNSCFVCWHESFEAARQHRGFRSNTRRAWHDALPWHQCALGLKTVFVFFAQFEIYWP